MTEPNNIGLLGSGVHRDPLKPFGRRLVFARHLSSPTEPAKLGMVWPANWRQLIIVTGRDERHTMQEAFAIGATFFLQKPVDRQKLSTLFRTAIGGMLENRRRNTRVPLQTEVICTVGSRTILGAAWNLSEGGMQLEASDLQSKDKVRLFFRFPVSGISIDVIGTVAWVGEKRQGIQFTTLSAEAQQSIRKYITEVEKV